MKILYLHQYFTTPDMAGGTRSYEMARRLVEWGHTVEMITTWREPKENKGWFETEEAGIKVHWLPVPYSNKMGFWNRIKAFLQFSSNAAKKAISLEGDIVFATSTPLTIAIPGVIASKWKRIPMVFEVRDLWPELPIAIGALKSPFFKKAALFLESFAYKNSAHIIGLSPGMVEGVIKTGYPKERISMIPNSSDLELFNPVDQKNKIENKKHTFLDKVTILYPGTLGAINGVDYIVELAALVAEIKPNIVFVTIGDGVDWNKIETKAKEVGVLNKNFFMHKPMPKSKLIGSFHSADIIFSSFIDLPEMWSNSANKFFDALAAAKPICINYQGWQSELIRDYKIGLVLPVKPDDAVQPLINFLSDKEELKLAGKRARKLAEEQFSRDILAKKLEEVLLGVYGNNK